MLKDKKYSRKNAYDSSDNTANVSKVYSVGSVVSIAISTVCILTLFFLPLMTETAPVITEKSPVGWILLALSAACILVNAFYLASDRKKNKSAEKELQSHKQFPIGLLNELEQPAAIFDTSGMVVWGNASFRGKAPRDILVSPRKIQIFHTFHSGKLLGSQ